MVMLETSLVKLDYDESINAVVWEPRAFMKADEWRTPFIKGVEFMKEKIGDEPDMTWLNDTRKLKTVSLEDLNWLNANVNEPLYKAGLKKVAFVLPTNVFGRMAVKFYVDFTNKRTDNQFQIKAFKEYDDAVTWLTAKSNVDVKEEIL